MAGRINISLVAPTIFDAFGGRHKGVKLYEDPFSTALVIEKNTRSYRIDYRSYIRDENLAGLHYEISKAVDHILVLFRKFNWTPYNAVEAHRRRILFRKFD